MTFGMAIASSPWGLRTVLVPGPGGGAEFAERLRLRAARTAALVARVDLERFGVRPVDVGGVEMWSARGRVSLSPCPESALAAAGFGVVFDLGGRVYVEPLR